MWLILFAVATPLSVLAGEVEPLVSFAEGFGFTYGDFDKAVTIEQDVVLIRAKSGKGGTGIHFERDLGPMADHSPVLHLRIEEGNEARFIHVLMIDAANQRRTFRYDLRKLEAGRWHAAGPMHWAALGDAAFDATRLRTVQVQGDWRATPIAVSVRRIDLVAPDEAMRAARLRKVEQDQKAAEAQVQQQQQRAAAVDRWLRDGVDHPDDGPEVRRMGAVAPDILAIEIVERRVVPAGSRAYEPQPDDVIRPGKGEPVLAWEGGAIVRAPRDRELHRRPSPDAAPQFVAYLFTPRGSTRTLQWADRLEGAAIIQDTLQHPQAYRIASDTDTRFASGVAPTRVERKSRPLDKPHHGTDSSVLHTLYLHLPAPLTEGADYTIHFQAVNTRQPRVTYRHRPRETRSEAVHASHIGHRPDDPVKRAYLSLWSGTGGALAYDIAAFEVLDHATGQAVFTGPVRRVLAEEDAEQLKTPKNHTGTNVYVLDYSALRTPGTYRVFVPGVGCSEPVIIADDAWRRAFDVSMRGFLHHRSGIDIGPPVTSYMRPRNMHTDDVPVFELDLTTLDGEAAAVASDLDRQLGEDPDLSRLRRHAGAWGGYMDAGDWDRRSNHLRVSLQHLELFELFPDYFASLPLSVPQVERANAIPDLLDEVIFHVDLYRRLQRADGGVGGGVESTDHPRVGEASWQESLLLGTFAPDPFTAYAYAGCAARLARVLAPFDATLAATYATSARRAWAWSEAQGDAALAAILERQPKKSRAISENVAEVRWIAAIELARLDDRKDTLRTFEEAKEQWSTDVGRHLDAIFAYARLPESLADPALREQCVQWVRQRADTAIEFQRGNAFGLATHAPGLPMMGYTAYYSAPEMVVGPVLPRAYVLTGDLRYLAAALAAAHYSAGANPLNMTMTTGVGHAWPTGVLHIDSRVTGQAAPAGITVYGPMDPAQSWPFADWAHTWILKPVMVPDSRTWPAAEFYVGVYLWPAMNEYTIHQTMRPTSYYWGFLAARHALNP